MSQFDSCFLFALLTQLEQSAASFTTRKLASCAAEIKIKSLMEESLSRRACLIASQIDSEIFNWLVTMTRRGPSRCEVNRHNLQSTAAQNPGSSPTASLTFPDMLTELLLPLRVAEASRMTLSALNHERSSFVACSIVLQA